MPNPSVDQVLQEVKQAIQQGATLPFDPTALDFVETRYKVPFQNRLNTANIWERDGANVINAARQLGVIATAIASLNQQHVIQKTATDAAADIVKMQCHITFHEGQWCP